MWGKFNMRKCYLIMAILLIAFISFSTVYAEGNDTDIYQSDGAVGNFNELNQAIQDLPDNIEIYLDKDYVFNESSDDKNLFKDGIIINKSVTIYGNNHVIDAKNAVRIFNINASVVIRNVVLLNGYHGYGNYYAGDVNGGGAINIVGGGLHLENAIVSNNTAYSSSPVKGTGMDSGGGAICLSGHTYLYVDNCTFVNNTVYADANVAGGAIMFRAGSAFNVTNCVFINNSALTTHRVFWNSGGAIGEIHVENSSDICYIENCTFINNTAGDGSAIFAQAISVIGNRFINSGIMYTWGAGRICAYNSFINASINFAHFGQALVKQNWFGVNPLGGSNHIVATIINDDEYVYVTLLKDGWGNNLSNPEYLHNISVKFEGNVISDNAMVINGIAATEINETLKEGYIYSVNATVDNQILELYFKYVKNNNFTSTIPAINEDYSHVNVGEFRIKGSNKVYHSLYEAVRDALLMDDDVTIYAGEGVFTEKWSDAYYNYEYMNYNFDIASNNKVITIIGAGNDKTIFKGETSGFGIYGNSTFRFVNITFADFTDDIFRFNSTNSNISIVNCIFRNISTVYAIYLSGVNSTLYIDGCYFDNVGYYPFWNDADNSYIVIDSTIFDKTNCNYALSEIYTVADFSNHISTIIDYTKHNYAHTDFDPNRHSAVVYHNFDKYYIFNHNFLLNEVRDGFDCTPYVYLSDENIKLGDSVDIIADFNYFTNASGMFKFDSNFIDDFTVSISTASGLNKVNLKNGVACLKYTPTASGTQTIIVKYGSKNAVLTLNIDSRQEPSFSVEGTENIIATLPGDAKGNVTFNVNGNKISKEVSNGAASINLAPLSDIKYTVEVIYNGDSKYMPANTTLVFSPYREITYLDIRCSDTPVYTEAIINVYTNANGNMKLLIDGSEYTTVINNGVATFRINDLPEGNHSILAIYGGNTHYLPENATGSINIIKFVPTISAYVKTVLSSENVIMNITMNDDISSEVYVFTNNRVYKTNVVNGVGYLNFTRLHGGTYNYRLYFNGNDKYYPSELNKVFTVTKLNTIYVDGNNGNDENMGTSKSDALKTLKCAIECVRYGGTIYLYDGVYDGAENIGLTLTQPVKIIGLGNNVVFDGEGKNYFFNINPGLVIDFKNINFKNMQSFVLNISRGARISVENCMFDGGSGSAFINIGTLTVISSTFKNINSQGIIINEGNLNLYDSTFDTISAVSIKGSAVSNYGNAVIFNCTFRNSTSYDSERVHGLVYNEGSMSLDSCIFDSNMAVFTMYPVGTANIYNKGVLNATYNVFIKNSDWDLSMGSDESTNHRYLDLYNDYTGSAYIDFNWWDCDDSPYDLHLTNAKPDLWVIPYVDIREYAPLNIGDVLDVHVFLVLNNGSAFNDDRLHLYAASFDGKVNQFKDYATSFVFNKTSVKASFNVPFKIGGFETSYLIEVGKNYSYMDVNKKDVNYGETLQIKIKVYSDNLVPTGNVTFFIGDKKYNLTLVNGIATLNVDKLMPATYDLKIVYEGDEDFFKKYYYGNVTVFKQKTYISIDLEDIMVGQKGVAHISIEPNTLVNALGFIYIDGVRRNIYFYQGRATYELRKFDLGKYDIRVEFLGNNYFESSSASTVFNVHKYQVNLTLSIDDIHVGERAYLYILKDPGDLSGDVHFIVEGTTQRDDYAYLSPEQSESRITLKNLGGGQYNITVFYGGDTKYGPFNTSVSFTVLKYTPTLNVTVTHNDTDAHFDFNLTSDEYSVPIEGVIQFWHNDNVTYINVTDGYAAYDINLTEGYNYLFAYYMGDANYNYTLWNYTIVVNIPFVLTGEDVVMNVGDDGGYGVILTNPYGRPLVNQSIIFNFTGDLYRGFTDVNGSAFFPMYYLEAGIYNITASCNETSINNTITVLKHSNYGFDVAYVENIDDNEITFTISVPDDATGIISINGVTANVADGQANITLTNLKKGNQTFNIYYSGDRKYENKSENITIDIGDDKKTILQAPDIEMFYHDGTRFQAVLTDRYGDAIAMQVVNVCINNVNYEIITDDEGKASLAINLASGFYNVSVSYESEYYTNSYVNSTISIYPTVYGWDVVKIYKNASRYVARFVDFNGNLLTVGEATFNINGMLYKRDINSEGLASIAINLDPGTYVITTTNPVTGESISNTITVLSCIVENHNLVKYYRNESQYTVRALDSKGNPVGAGEYVLFNINGVFYARQTNASGYATLNINLNPGDYIVTAEYNFCKVSNTIKVRPILSAYNLVKKAGTSNPFRAFLLDGRGRPLEGATVIFNVNGVLYERITDIDGVAKLNINLMPGRYIITSMYNGSSISNNITIA